MTELDQHDWAAKAAETTDAIILDVRTPEEWEEGTIPGAVRMNILDSAAFLQELESMEKEKSYFVYCRSGGRSAQACMIMDSKGFADTHNLVGGIMEWDGGIER